MADQLGAAADQTTDTTTTGTETGKTQTDQAGTTAQKDFETRMKDAGLWTEHETLLKSTGDKRATQAAQTAREKAVKELEDKKGVKDTVDITKPGDIKEIDGVKTDISNLTKLVTEFLGKSKQDTLNQKKVDALTAVGLDPSLASRILTTDETEIVKEVEEFKGLVTKGLQTAIDEHIEKQNHPLSSMGSSEGALKDKLKTYTESKKTNLKGTALEGKLS